MMAIEIIHEVKAHNFHFQMEHLGIGLLRLNRPEIHNAFNQEMIDELFDLFNKLRTDERLRLLIITGEGKSFCAGADINWMKKMVNYTPEENKADSHKLATMFGQLNSFPRPVIGLINGAAIGGGTGLVAICDYVLALDSAVFGLSEVRLGILPAVIGPYVVAKIGESNARAVFLSGERFDALRALNMGLVHQVVSAAEAKEALAKVVAQFLKAAPQAQGVGKQLISTVRDCSDMSKVCQYTIDLITKLRVSSEGQHGMACLLARSVPDWAVDENKTIASTIELLEQTQKGDL